MSTSAEALEAFVASGRHATHTALVYSALRHDYGRTLAEIGFETGLQNVQVQRRLTDLMHDGRARIGPARKCGVTRRRCQTWWLVKTQRELFLDDLP